MKAKNKFLAIIATMLSLGVVVKGTAAFNEQALMAGEDKFGCAVFQSLVKDNKDKNIFVSPTSLTLALGMAAVGARGKTFSDMKTTLDVPQSVTEKELVETLHTAMSELKSKDPAVQFEVANAVLVGNAIPIKKDYLSLLKEQLDCKSENVDFGSPNTQSMIDKWVSRKTKGKINQLKLQLNKSTAAVILNALYFKGAWKTPFNKEWTKPVDFHNQKGNVVKVPMMFQSEQSEYLKTEQFQAIKIPFGNGSYSAIVFLPTKKNADELVGIISGANVETWNKKFELAPVALSLPKFKIDYEAELSQTLSMLGMKSAFGDSADFTGISAVNSGIKIGQVVHKTALEVDENGATAAAVTAVEPIAGGPPPKQIDMTVDHPFVFAIYDDKQHSLRFIGCIRNL